MLAARLYGVGPVTALTMTCWLAGEGRFSSSRKAVRFAGLDITVYSSDRKGPPGRFSRQGPPLLRWAVYEADKTHAHAAAPDHGYYTAVRNHLQHPAHSDTAFSVRGSPLGAGGYACGVAAILSQGRVSLWRMSDERPKALLKLPIKEVVKAGPKAPLVLVRHVIESEGPRLSVEADGHRRSSDFDVEEYVDRLITRQLMLVRGQGALAGLAMVGAGAAAAAEVVAAPLGVTTIAAAILGDLATLSYFQIELSLKIAAAYGHDLGDHETRVREIFHLHGLEMIGGDNLGPVIGKGGERVGKRLLMRYLKGDALKAAKSLFRFVGIKFARAGLIKMLPFVNVPAGAAVADITTRRSASKARKFYAMLPPPEESVPV